MALSPSIRELERVQISAPLGVRFWDSLSQRFLIDGLYVTATAVSNSGPARVATPNRNTGFVFHSLPGLRDWELGDDRAPFDSSPPLRHDFIIRMIDTRERFLPLTFRASAPHQGWFVLPCDPDPETRPADSIPLFPSPSLSLGSGIASVRADLWDVAAQRPASWAVVEARATTPTGSSSAVGLANADGRVVVAFAYPESLPPVPATSPPQGTPRGLAGQAWTLDLNILYARLSGDDHGPPDLCHILAQPAAVSLDQPSPETPLNTPDLEFGRDLVLRSSGDTQGRVLIRPA